MQPATPPTTPPKKTDQDGWFGPLMFFGGLLFFFYLVGGFSSTSAKSELTKSPASSSQTYYSTSLAPVQAGKPSTVQAGGSTSGRYYDPTYRPPVGDHYVSGYYRKDGTYVSGHYRTNRDNSFWNNYSSHGNKNPHTGRTGTKLPGTGSSRRR